MADFAAVLRKAIEALKDNTPQTREKVYQKARATIEAKLAAVSPPPPPQLAERQRTLLEEAIANVEAEFTPPPPPATQGDELDDVLAELNAPARTAAPAARVASAEGNGAEATTAWNQPAAGPSYSPAAEHERPVREDPPVDVHQDEWRQPPAWTDHGADDGMVEGPEALAHDEDVELAGSAPKRRRRAGRLVPLLLLLLVLAGACYGAWFYRDDMAQLAGFDSFDAATDQLSALVAEPETSEPVAAAPTETAEPAPPAESEADTPPAEERPQKFTQRLMPDGREVDEGPAGGAAGLGEGTSVAASTPGTTPPAQGQQAQAPAGGNAEAGSEAVAVGQKAIFYEERTSSSQGSADNGSVVWSIVQESPGDNLPPEPAIRAEATVPEKGLQLKMTIRRNADQSLPASHIVELIFLTPQEFEGGSISNVLRVAMKQNEQDTGSPLLGVPAKIADGFFLMALSDSRADIETNLVLMRRQSWIDIPIVYASGRRALITMEKGVPGERIFGEALDAWQRASSG